MTDVQAQTKQLIKLVASKDELAVRAFTAAVPAELRTKVASGQPGDYCTPLVAACIVGSLPILRYLLEVGADCNVPRSDGCLPLHIAIVSPHADESLLAELLRAGAEVNGREEDGGTPLHCAVRGKSLAHVKMLVEHGAVVDATEYKVTTTPLLIAAFSNQTDVASYLLAKGADPNKAQNDSAGTTPLFAAALQGDLATVDILLEAGADPNFVDTSGYTTVMSACDSPALGFEGRQPLAIVRKLLDLGVPINHAARDGSTALYMAAMHRLGDVVEELISRGADVHASLNGSNRKTPKGVTPLQIASQKGCLVSVRALIKAGADVNAMDAVGTIPLISACRNGSQHDQAFKSIIAELIDAGSLTDHKNLLGDTPQNLAAAWLEPRDPLWEKLKAKTQPMDTN